MPDVVPFSIPQSLKRQGKSNHELWVTLNNRSFSQQTLRLLIVGKAQMLLTTLMVAPVSRDSETGH